MPDKVFTSILSMYPEGAYARNLGGMYPLHLAASNKDMDTKKIALAALDRGTHYALFGHLACGELLATMFIVNHVIVGVSYGMKDPKECADDDDDGDDGRSSGDGGIGGKRVCKPTTMMGNTPMERTRMRHSRRAPGAAVTRNPRHWSRSTIGHAFKAPAIEWSSPPDSQGRPAEAHVNWGGKRV